MPLACGSQISLAKESGAEWSIQASDQQATADSLHRADSSLRR